jgi:hypothetical protein
MSKVAVLILSLVLTACATKPVIETKLVDRLVPVQCTVEMPAECKDSYAVDKVSSADDALTINRSLRAEIEERWACEIKLRAAVKGCNKSP